MTTDVSLNGVEQGLEVENVEGLDDFYEEPSGAWPAGWYAAEIVEGYTTPRGKTFLTEDTVSQKGDSRNLRLCVKVTRGDQERTMQESYNYRASDFDAQRQAFIKEARTENKEVRGRWGDGDAQRSSLALVSLSQIKKAVGSLSRANGAIVVGPFYGKKVDVKLVIDEKGYNEIKAIAPAGTKTASPARKSA
jgi:hypothetical protein